ncbi:MAG: multidrug transporter permease [Bacteroidetes bacterium]|nr:multidrug transporter permease [Bacteroidota bacterium]
MKQLLSFIHKEFLHIFRDTWTMMIIIALPIVMMILFGYAVTTEIKNTNFGVLDYSKDDLSKGIVNKLKSSEYFIYENDGYNNYQEAEESFKNGDVGIILVFEENFYENLTHTGKANIQILADGSDPNTARTLVTYASSIINIYLQEKNPSPTPYQITPEIKFLYNPQLKGSYNSVPGVIGMIIMLICAMMTAVSITREKERGTMEVLLVSPIKPIYIIIAKLTPYFVISVINVIIIFIISHFIMGVPIAGNMFWITILCILYIIVSLALGLLISTIAHTQVIALLISGMVMMLPAVYLSGMMFPIENMPWILQFISNIIPARWFVAAIRKIMIMGVEVRYIVNEMVILVTMIIVLVAISLKKFKQRLE